MKKHSFIGGVAVGVILGLGGAFIFSRKRKPLPESPKELTFDEISIMKE